MKIEDENEMYEDYLKGNPGCLYGIIVIAVISFFMMLLFCVYLYNNFIASV